jgi:glycosyltransferase involved in cell wall biosynthesis
MNRDGRRLLLVLRDLPQGPGSGAARSMASICELLAEAGWQVRALCTTTSESQQQTDILTWLDGMHISVERLARHGPELRYRHRGVQYRTLVTPPVPARDWEKVHGRRFDRAFEEELNAFQPQVMFTYGMFAGDVRRQRLAIHHAVKVVFGLRNEHYLGFTGWDHVSAVLTPSQYLSDRYRDACGLESTPLLVPLDAADIVAPDHDPIFITFINPSVQKGVEVFARIAEKLSVQRPDLPFLVIESRGRAGTLLAAGERAGIDLRRHENIMISPPVPSPKDIFQPTRLLLVPSLQEAGARVVAEALMNGVPPLVSNRGGLPEMCGGAGRVLPIGSEQDIDRWIDAIVLLMDDDAQYGVESERARRASHRFDRDQLRPEYDRFFAGVLMDA